MAIVQPCCGSRAFRAPVSRPSPAQLERALFEAGCQTMLLDGDQLRHGLSGDLGFDDVARRENIRRAGEVARLFFEQGTIRSARSCHRSPAIVLALGVCCRLVRLSRSTSTATLKNAGAGM